MPVRARVCCFVLVTACGGSSSSGSEGASTPTVVDIGTSTVVETPIARPAPRPTTSESGGDDAGEIAWLRDDLDAAWTEAERRGRPLLIYVRASWKPESLEVERSTLRQASVVRAARPYLAVLVDLGDQETLTRVEARVGAEAVSRLPSFVLVDTRSGRRQVSSVSRDAERLSGELAAFVSDP